MKNIIEVKDESDVLVESLLDGSAKVDLMRKQALDVVSMVVAFLSENAMWAWRHSDHVIDRKLIFQSATCQWEFELQTAQGQSRFQVCCVLFVPHEESSTGRVVAYLHCPWQKFEKPKAVYVARLRASLPTLVHGMLEAFPGITDTWDPFFRLGP